ncbi:Transcription elongation factor TFIIS/Cofactor of enhancer-binding protein Sp1 [Handroanthus impetiginosus]|uniref:Transcription elongation factor n=1 Tax=Handroanthus impetiginosus TaxID=429701 RepID=A0A2G9HNS7_9LAMI|nr:Transcription elongation factor TFIIS/Cofactor of enhancer-binding protein Sp1 [Handroanthus impetiginosus]
MEKDLRELFELVKRTAEVAEHSPGEEDRCLDALKRLKKFPVNYQVLVSTQVGKGLRQLTKHKSSKIKTLASDVVGIWKTIIVKETMRNKKNDAFDNGDPAKPERATSTETKELKNNHRTNSVKEISSNVKIEKVEVVQKARNAAGEHLHIDKKPKLHNAISEGQKPTTDPVGPPKLSALVYCKDPARDKVREILAEALCKVSTEISDDLRNQVNECDPYRIAVLVETTMFEKWGKSSGTQKAKYRSILFNIKDQNNPDFRRKVLLGEFELRGILELRPEEMASDARQVQNEKIKQKALFNSELGGPPQASTDQFTCGRCKKKETTYYQMQTRSADEPMTTFVTCVNCNNRWKFC